MTCNDPLPILWLWAKNDPGALALDTASASQWPKHYQLQVETCDLATRPFREPKPKNRKKTLRIMVFFSKDVWDSKMWTQIGRTILARVESLFAKDNGLGGAFDYDVEVEVGQCWCFQDKWILVVAFSRATTPNQQVQTVQPDFVWLENLVQLIATDTLHTSLHSISCINQHLQIIASISIITIKIWCH